MPGLGQPGCLLYQYTWEILERWPKLEYLPRSEPPDTYVLAHKHWLREYSHWKDLKCKRQMGAYFCRRHGKWITCEEIEANLASLQKEERYKESHRCPPSHYEWEDLQEDFFARQRKQIEVIAAENAAAAATVHNQVDDNQNIESQFEQMSLGQSDYQEATEAYPPQQPTYDTPGYPNYYTHPSESIPEQPYESPSTSKRDSKGGAGYSTSRSYGKSSGSQSSKPHSSKSYSSKPQSSKSSRTSYSSPRPSTSSTYHQKQHAGRSEHGVDDYEADSYYDPVAYATEEQQAEPQPYTMPYWSGGGR